MATNIPLSSLMGTMTTKSRAKLGGYTGRMQDLSLPQRETVGLGYPNEGSTAWQKLQPGYTPTAPTTPSVTPTTPAGTGMSPQDEAAMKLAQALRGQGVNWNYTQGQSYAPPASLIGGVGWKRIQNMPSLYTLMLQAAQASGVPQADFLAEIQQFQHAAPGYQGVSYGW